MKPIVSGRLGLMVNNLPFFLILLFSINSWAYRPGTFDTNNYNECLWTEKAIDSYVECNDLYHHYKPKRARYNPKGNQVRLGAFNIFRLSEQRKNKNFKWMTELINSEWDVVALSELQVSNSTLQKSNGKLFTKLEKGTLSRREYSKEYVLPAYALLLRELQKKDPSWGLVVSAYSQGIDSELLGFLYRGNQVKIIESQYCHDHYLNDSPWPNRGFIYRETGKKGFVSNKQGNPINDREFISPHKALACPLALEGVDREQFPKVPLTARFRSGNFNFNYISLHLSFGSFGEIYKKCRSRCQLNALRLLSTFSGEDKNDIFNFITDYIRENETRIARQEVPKPSNCNSQCKKNFRKKLEKIESSIMSPVYTTINKMAEENSIFSDVVLPVLLKLNKEDKNARPKISKEEGRELNRFFQTKAVMEAATEISFTEDSNDVIVAGDFNLELAEKGEWQELLWKEALSLFPNSEVLVDEKTSITFSSKEDSVVYVSNYDHFVLVNDRGATDECDRESASRVDFINELYELANGYKLGKYVQIHEDETVEVDERYEHPLSDHVPISITCSTNGMT